MHELPVAGLLVNTVQRVHSEQFRLQHRLSRGTNVLRGMHVAQVVAHISVGLCRSLDVVAMCRAGFACSSQSVAGVAATMWLLQVLMHASVGQALGRFRHRFGALGRCMCCCICCVLGVLH